MANRSRKRAYDGSRECCADWTTAQLRELRTYPPFECFYTPELTKLFLRVYQQDMTAYEQLSKKHRWRHADVA